MSWTMRTLLAALAAVGTIAAGCGEKEEVRSPVVSKDGKSVAHVVKAGEKQHVVKDGEQIGEAYEEVSELVFDNDGSVVFKVTTGARQFVVKNGKRVGNEYEEVGNPVPSPNDGSVVFRAQLRGKSFLVNGGVKVPGSEGVIGDPVFDAQGKMAYMAEKNDKMILVSGDREYGHDDPGITTWTMSPSGSIAYVANNPNAYPSSAYVVKDGVKVYGQETAAAFGKPALSSDGKSMAIVAVRHMGGKARVLLDGEQVGGEYDRVKGLEFSSNGRSLMFIAEKDGKYLVVRDGTPVGDAYDRVWGTTCSPDGSSVALVALKDGKQFVILDGKQVNPPGFTAFGVPFFSPNGRSLAYLAWAGRQVFVVKDGRQASEAFDGVHSLKNSPDGTGILFAATRGTKVIRGAIPW